MKVAIIGAGNVGGTLGKQWSMKGHEIVFGVRKTDSDKVTALLKMCTNSATATTIEEAANQCDIIALAVPWIATKEVIEALGNLTGKVLIDCTNPIGAGLVLTHGYTTSGGEQVAEWAKGAKVVKSFNSTGWENMANSDYGSVKPTMFFCGDNAEAKEKVMFLIEDLSFEPYDIGELKMCRYLEPMSMIWIIEARVKGKGANFAFKIIKR